MSGADASLLLIGLVFVFAGAVKGVIGMGLPTIAIGLLGLLMPPAEAAALLVIPSLATNVWQFATGPHHLRLLRRLWPMLVAIAGVTWGSAGLIASGSAGEATTALGAVLVVYAAIGLAKIRLSVAKPFERWVSPLIGAATGIVTGATGVLVIPAGPYLQALAFDKEDLVQALGLSFTVSTLALGAGLASHGAFHLLAAGASLLCTLPALAGMLLGRWLRGKVAPASFRLLFFAGLLLLGADLVARAAL